jgi:ribosome-associated protein
MQELDFRLTGEFIALDDLLKVTGVCASGGAGKALVAAGKVSVDGIVERRRACKIRAGRVVRVDEVRIVVLGNAGTP